MNLFYSTFPLKNVQQVEGQEYDYVVVGGGTAGCVVASRLSEDPAVKVLLIEKGNLDDYWLSRIPLASCINGKYMVRRAAQSSLGTESKQHEVFAAEALGGSSRLNAMIYTHGCPAYYDQWAQSGFPNWSWNSVEPYFHKVEDTGVHSGTTKPTGMRGNVELRQYNPASAAFSYIQKAAETLGLQPDENMNRPDAPTNGYFHLHLTIDPDGLRHSAERAYLPYQLVAQRQKSLHICTGAAVVKLDIPSGSTIARGVVLQPVSADASHQVRVSVRREIVLCGGAICTPQILQLSGFGPSDLMKKYDIPIREHLAGVGSHLLDHSGFPVWIDIATQDTFQKMAKSPWEAAKQFAMFLLFRSGWLRSSFDRAIYINTADLDMENMTVFPALPSSSDNQKQKIPDVEIMLLPGNSKPDIYPDKSSLTLQIILNQPISSGTVQITSTDPFAHPEISLGILSDPRDKEVARKALRFSLHLAEKFVHHSGYPHAAAILDGPGSGEGDYDWRCIPEKDLDKYIEKHIDVGHHLTSTCRMAKREEGGVVDEELRVYGLTNVRIADASVLPNVPPAHPMAAVYMIGERCADFVKSDWEREML